MSGVLPVAMVVRITSTDLAPATSTVMLSVFSALNFSAQRKRRWCMLVSSLSSGCRCQTVTVVGLALLLAVEEAAPPLSDAAEEEAAPPHAARDSAREAAVRDAMSRFIVVLLLCLVFWFSGFGKPERGRFAFR